MPIHVFPALLSTPKRICDVIRSDVINYLNNKNLTCSMGQNKKNGTIFSSPKYSILPNSQSSSKKTEEKKSRGLTQEDEHGSGKGGGSGISLNCYNSRNICHSEGRFSVLEPPNHALSDDKFGGLKLENLHTTFL